MNTPGDIILNTSTKPECLLAAAKLNIGLSIVGRRLDGYHLIQSLFWPIELCDSIEIIESRSASLATAWDKEALRKDTLPTVGNNLLDRVLDAVRDRIPPLEIRLTKRIPIGAGLGGGSSDAGSLLRHFVSKGFINEQEAEKIAIELGADVPFFLDPRPAWVSGIGETRHYPTIDPSLEDLHFLIVVPPFGVETRQVFNLVRQLQTFRVPTLDRSSYPESLSLYSLKVYLKETENRLTPHVSALYPQIASILHALKETPTLYSGLSGTGSTCFAIFESPRELETAAKDLASFFRKNLCRTAAVVSFNEKHKLSY